MKNTMKFHSVQALLLVGALLLFCGCSSLIQVSVPTPGEFKLGGVSKLAIVKFNSLSDDNSVGIYSADETTISLTQALVASAFEQGKVYKVTNLANENAIADAEGTGRAVLQSTLSNRFDALIYGRVWWQLSPENHGVYPKVYRLERWRNVPYRVVEKNVLTNEEKVVQKVAHVTTSQEDQLVTQAYRHWNANLMLSLSVYRLDAQGQITKLVETYSVATMKYFMRNGVFGCEDAKNIGARSASRAEQMQKANKNNSVFGSFATEFKKAWNESQTGEDAVATAATTTGQNSVSFPTNLQTQYQLATFLTSDLTSKLSPKNISFEITYKFSDDKLKGLLEKGAFLAGEEYSDYAFSEALHAKFGKKDGQLLVERDQLLQAVDGAIAEEYAKSSKAFKKAAEENIDYLYAKGLCLEGQGKFSEALAAYRLAFEAVPSRPVALGISRCLFAMDMATRVKETAKDATKATKKSNLK